jgi:hypothetical protein
VLYVVVLLLVSASLEEQAPLSAAARPHLAQSCAVLCRAANLPQVLFGPAFFKRHGLQAVQDAFLSFEGEFEVSRLLLTSAETLVRHMKAGAGCHY